ncbi:MAG: DNA polymerase III subunit epsilon [Alphaproteobacteria bacterium]
MREIILDTETTGFEPKSGHKIVEIGCIEIINRKRTGVVFHHYIHPERDIPEDAFRVHGISLEMLAGKPVFAQIASELHEFIKDTHIVAHNAPFDVKFINHELKNSNLPHIHPTKIIDTLAIARKKFPGSPASLDALCKRFNIDLTKRDKHGALLDAELLCDVYIELTGGTQNTMVFDMKVSNNINKTQKKYREARNFSVSEEEKNAHIEFMKKIKNPIWS